jgi:hypothetical protein
MADVNDIEARLGVTLPAAYRAVMTNYPFVGKDWANCQLEKNLEELIVTNLAFRQGEFGGLAWPDSRFTFGHDGAGNSFFLDLATDDPAVYCVDHETHAVTREAADLQAWANQWNADLQAAAAARTAAPTKQPWWKFW